jgi:hypothetical protein
MEGRKAERMGGTVARVKLITILSMCVCANLSTLVFPFDFFPQLAFDSSPRVWNSSTQSSLFGLFLSRIFFCWMEDFLALRNCFFLCRCATGEPKAGPRAERVQPEGGGRRLL